MKDLTQDEASAIFSRIACGEMPPSELSELLLGLKEKGETPAEIAGAASAFLDAASPFPMPDYELSDCVGTGGDGLGTLNVSTAAMFVAGEMGLKMAKHGNVAVSSKCGSADVLSKAGVKIDMSPKTARKCLDETGVTFLYAPKYHPGMKHAASVRKDLGVRTIFNILGPLINPVRPQVQLTGVYSEQLVRPYAETLNRLGLKRGLVVHGSGLDEIAVHGPTTACLIKDGDFIELELHPNWVGLKTYPLNEVLGGDIEQNSDALHELLAGQGSEAYSALVAFNAGALCWVFGQTKDLSESVGNALETIRSGKALQRLRKFVEMSHHD